MKFEPHGLRALFVATGLALASPEALAGGRPPVPVCGPCAPDDDASAWRGHDARRGPIQIRDAYLLAQPRLTLPSVSPDTVGRGRTTLHGLFHWSSSFGFNQDDLGDGEAPIARRYLVDGEARTFEMTVTHGLCDDLDLAVRVPLHWRGAGVLDPLIDSFHEATSFATLDNDRNEFDTGRYRVEGVTKPGDPFSWDDVGTGLGDVEASLEWRFADGGREGLSLAAVGRVTAPTSTGPFEPGGVGAGLQVVAAQRLGRRFDAFLGLGGTAQSDREVDGVRFEAFRGHAFAALEWRPARSVSLVLSVDAASRLVEDVAVFPAEHVYLHLDAKVDLGPRATLEMGFTENLMNQQATADFAIHVGITVRL